MSDILSYFKTNESNLKKDYFKLLSFRSISTDSTKREESANCAKWISNYLEEAGFKTELWQTKRNPVVFAEYQTDPQAPTLLIYNHYDVQPVDPISHWQSDPFEARVEGDVIYARGAQDNKGQCFYVLAAVTGFLKHHGKLPINVKLIIEGDEEIGSPDIEALLLEKKDRLSSTEILVVDVGFHSLDKPSVTLGLRGTCAMEVTLIGSNTDLHSGSHGGVVYNPNHALVEILSKLRNADGSINIKEFYEDVLPFTPPSELAKEFDAEDYFKSFGARPSGGEKAFSPLERAWFRPTLEINGLVGGYTEAGVKTVIPARSTAKISFRLVPNQDPHKIRQAVKAFIERNLPEGITSEIIIHPGHGKAVRAKPGSRIIKVASESISEVMGKPCSSIFEGASIPIASKLSEIVSENLVLIGFGLPTDNIHAPNEQFSWSRITYGFQTITKIIQKLASAD